MALTQISQTACFGGTQGTYEHISAETHCAMRFAVFTPPEDKAVNGKFPVIFWLSGLTCTEENFTVKAGAQRVAAELGVMLVMPDTSPRGEGTKGDPVPGDPDGEYNFGHGAGFYVDATQAPWKTNYKMYSYVALELPSVIAAHFPADLSRRSIMGHSMGGHGALTIALRMPGVYRAVSAFAPICAPSQVAWGRKALGGYLGNDESLWRKHDSVALIEDGARVPELLVDQGDADPFLGEHLRPDLLVDACKSADIPMTLNMRPGYDHGYFFISTFIENHLRWHAQRL